MMGRQNNDQGPLFYEFCLDEAVPDDHLVRKIDAVLDLSWVHEELAPHYPTLGRPSIDPVLMIRMLIIGYVFALRSERLLCREVQHICSGSIATGPDVRAESTFPPKATVALQCGERDFVHSEARCIQIVSG